MKWLANLFRRKPAPMYPVLGFINCGPRVRELCSPSDPEPLAFPEIDPSLIPERQQ